MATNMITDKMGPGGYSNAGDTYNYELNPKGAVFLDYYFSLPPLNKFLEKCHEGSSKILDLGSGEGRESDKLKKILPSAKVVSVDATFDLEMHHP